MVFSGRCDPSCSGRAVDTSSSLKAVATCNDCKAADEISLLWSLFTLASDGSYVAVTDFETKTSTGIDQYEVQLKPNVLVIGESYKLEVEGWRDGGAKGKSSVSILTVLPTIPPTTVSASKHCYTGWKTGL